MNGKARASASASQEAAAKYVESLKGGGAAWTRRRGRRAT